MYLILVCLLTAVQPTPVAHQRTALAPHQLQRPEIQQIWRPPRPVVVLQAAVTQLSQTALPATHCHQDRPVHPVLRKL